MSFNNQRLVPAPDIHSSMNVDTYPGMAGNSSFSTGGSGEQAQRLSLARLQQLQFQQQQQQQQCNVGMNTPLPPHPRPHSLNTLNSSLQHFKGVNVNVNVNTNAINAAPAAVSEMSFPSAHDEGIFMAPRDAPLSISMDQASPVNSSLSPEPLLCNKPGSSSGTSTNSPSSINVNINKSGGKGPSKSHSNSKTKGSKNVNSGAAGEKKKAERYFVDHTYRDFSRKKPTEKDIIDYKHQKQINADRLRNGDIKMEESMDTASCGSGSGSANVGAGSSSKSKSALKKTGRGNKANKKGNTNFSGSMGTNFPARLHDLLSHEEGISDIITWLPHGRSWIVWDKEKFIDTVASLRFQMSKSESFSRQVNAWGFKRITQGPDINSYYHELFLKGMPHLVKWMKRAPSSSCGTTKRLRASPDDEPNFYEISRQFPIPDYYNENGGRPISVCRPLTSMGVGPPSSIPGSISASGSVPESVSVSASASMNNYPVLPVSSTHSHIDTASSSSNQAVPVPEQKEQSPPRRNRLRRTGGYFAQNGNNNVNVPQHRQENQPQHQPQQHADMSMLSKGLGHPFASRHGIAHPYAANANARANAVAACVSEKQKLLEQMCTTSIATLERPDPKRVKIEVPVARDGALKNTFMDSNDTNNSNGNANANAFQSHAVFNAAGGGHIPDRQLYQGCNNDGGYFRCISNTDESMNHEEVPSREEWGSFCDALSSYLEEGMSENSCDGVRNRKLKRGDGDDDDDDDDDYDVHDGDDDDSFFRMITESIDPATMDDNDDHESMMQM